MFFLVVWYRMSLDAVTLTHSDALEMHLYSHRRSAFAPKWHQTRQLFCFYLFKLSWDGFSISLRFCLCLALLETFCLVVIDQGVLDSVLQELLLFNLDSFFISSLFSSISRGDSRRMLSVRVVESLHFQKKTSSRCLNLHLLPHAWKRFSSQVLVGSPAGVLARLSI